MNANLLHALIEVGSAEVLRQLAAAAESAAAGCGGGDALSRRWDRAAGSLRGAARAVAIADVSGGVTLAEAAVVLDGE